MPVADRLARLATRIKKSQTKNRIIKARFQFLRQNRRSDSLFLTRHFKILPKLRFSQAIASFHFSFWRHAYRENCGGAPSRIFAKNSALLSRRVSLQPVGIDGIWNQS